MNPSHMEKLMRKRANILHNHTQDGHEYTQAQLNDIWAKTVRTKEDAENYFLKFHPEMTDTMAKAFAHYFNRAVTGDLQLPEKYTGKE